MKSSKGIKHFLELNTSSVDQCWTGAKSFTPLTPRQEGVPRQSDPLRSTSTWSSVLADVVSVVDGFLLDVLGRSPLVQIQKGLEQPVQAGLLALFLDPVAQQVVNLVFVGQVVPAFDGVVPDAEVTEEPLVVVHVDFFEEVEALPERLLTCRRRHGTWFRVYWSHHQLQHAYTSKTTVS